MTTITTTAFCPACVADVKVRVEDRRQKLTVRGEAIDVLAKVAVCTVCGEDVWSDALEDETLARAFAEYRSRHGLLQPTEMTRVRSRWGLGQRAFALLLGWGEITLHRYESGSLQDAAHDAQLRMAEHADNIRILLASNGGRLTGRQRTAVEQRLAGADCHDPRSESGDDEFERLLTRAAAGAFGGGVPVSLTKVREMIAFFAEAPDLFVTKLAKLMFYADFLQYKERTVSITGLAYARLPAGPVPEHYERIRADVRENSIVETEERCGDDWAGEILVACRRPKLGVFTQEELAVLESVRERLGSKTSRSLSEMSHAETAWTATAMGRRIPYERARELSLTLAG